VIAFCISQTYLSRPILSTTPDDPSCINVYRQKQMTWPSTVCKRYRTWHWHYSTAELPKAEGKGPALLQFCLTAASAYHCICNLFLGKIWNLFSMRSSRPALILPLLLSITSVMFVVLTICHMRTLLSTWPCLHLTSSSLAVIRLQPKTDGATVHVQQTTSHLPLSLKVAASLYGPFSHSKSASITTNCQRKTVSQAEGTA